MKVLPGDIDWDIVVWKRGEGWTGFSYELGTWVKLNGPPIRTLVID
jgi:hypothetical protein